MALLRGVWNSDMVARFVLGVLCIEAFFLKDRGHALDVTVICSAVDRQRAGSVTSCSTHGSFLPNSVLLRHYLGSIRCSGCI